MALVSISDESPGMQLVSPETVFNTVAEENPESGSKKLIRLEDRFNVSPTLLKIHMDIIAWCFYGVVIFSLVVNLANVSYHEAFVENLETMYKNSASQCFETTQKHYQAHEINWAALLPTEDKGVCEIEACVLNYTSTIPSGILMSGKYELCWIRSCGVEPVHRVTAENRRDSLHVVLGGPFTEFTNDIEILVSAVCSDNDTITYGVLTTKGRREHELQNLIDRTESTVFNCKLVVGVCYLIVLVINIVVFCIFVTHFFPVFRQIVMLQRSHFE